MTDRPLIQPLNASESFRSDAVPRVREAWESFDDFREDNDFLRLLSRAELADVLHSCVGGAVAASL